MSGRIKKIRVANFKSIEKINIEFGDVTFLVGLNGSGKSNIIDSLSFLSDCLAFSIDYAIRIRGGAYSVFRQASKSTRLLSISVDFLSESGVPCVYTMILKISQYGLNILDKEELKIKGGIGFKVEGNKVTKFTDSKPPVIMRDRMFLHSVSGLPEYREYYDLLSSIRIYSPNPDAMRQLYSPDTSLSLKRDASNLASITKNMNTVEKRNSGYLNIVSYMKKINKYFYGFSLCRGQNVKTAV